MDINFIGVWIGALLTLFIFSFLYKDNPFYRFAEYLYVGISAGYFFAYDWHNVVIPNLYIPLKNHQFDYLIALFLGITILFRLIPKYGWVSRYGFAYSIGLGAGINFIIYLQANCLQQVQATILPVIVLKGGFDIWKTLGNLLMIVGVSSALIYFYFSKPHKGILGGTARLGIWFLMISFGASFGYTVMSRISLLIGRIQFLIDQWIKPTIALIRG
ncbi:MAG: hypothetical protein ACUVWP_00095 [bacterium]